MLFIATADAEGRPAASSYKGGDPGVRARGSTSARIASPNYDGNGMYLTAGDMLVNPNVGLLFIDFEGRKRMRLNGVASSSGRERPAARRVSRGAVRDPCAGADYVYMPSTGFSRLVCFRTRITNCASGYSPSSGSFFVH